MKLIALAGAGALLVSRAAAQECVNVALEEIPSCAQSCFLDGAPSVGCGGTDFACQCEKEAALYAAIEGCVQSGCPSASIQNVIDGASSVCACATAGAVKVVGSGSLTVSVPPGSSFPTSFPSSIPTSPPESSAATTTIGGGGGGGAVTPPPTITPTATVGVPSFGNRKAAVSLGVVGSVMAALALVAL